VDRSSGFFDYFNSVHWSVLYLLVLILVLLVLSQIEKKPILNPKCEPVMQSLTEGIKFVFNNKTVLGELTPDMVAVLFGGVHFCFFHKIFLKGGFGFLRAASN
jgi:hypothetical protein